MPEPRRHQRWIQRLQIRTWPVGQSEKARTAYTRDLSPGGAYITTNRAFRKDTRLQLEFETERGAVIFEGVVARAVTVPRELQAVKSGGMGVRFLSSEELVAELQGGAAGEPIRSALRGGAGLGQVETARAPQPLPVAPHKPGGAAKCFPVKFRSPAEFLRAYERDLRFGTLFVATNSPPTPGSPVDLVLHLPKLERTVPVAGEVAHVVERSSLRHDGSVHVGMGVRIKDSEALHTLAAMVTRYRGD